MCHHVAALIEQSKSARTAELRRTAQREAVSAILSIWEKRTSLPGNAYPLARYKYLLQCIAATSPDSSIWETSRQSSVVDAAGNIFRSASEIVNLALSLNSKPPLFKRKKDRVPSITVSFLEMIEAKLLHAAEALDDRSLEMLRSIRDSKDSSSNPEKHALKALLKQIGSTHDALNALAEGIETTLAGKNDSVTTAELRTDD